MKLAQALQRIAAAKDRTGTPLHVNLACGFTPQHVATFLTAYLLERQTHRPVIVRTGVYGDVIGSLRSIAEQPEQQDYTVALLEWEDLDPRWGYRNLGDWSAASVQDMFQTAHARLEHIASAVQAAALRGPVVVVPPTLPFPCVQASPVCQLTTSELRLQAALQRVLLELSEHASVRILHSGWLERNSPPVARHDLVGEFRWHLPYTTAHAAQLCQQMVSLLLPSNPLKGLITDLDDTLWRGIVGDEGAQGVHWNLNQGSQIHALYQKLLASLADSGILLAIASKNDPQVVEQALQRTDLLVPKECFYPVECSWGAKSIAVEKILKAWNVGPESVAYVDDNPLELAEVGQVFPHLTCLQATPDNEPVMLQLLVRLRELFGKETVSAEDRLRRSSLQAAAVFSGDSSVHSAEDLLASLNAIVTFSRCSSGDADTRSLELINKTNQFNLNGRRIDVAAWQSRLSNPRYLNLIVTYEDKFGPLGRISVLSGELKERQLDLDVWVLSCRAFSRRIEHMILQALFDHFQVAQIQLDVCPTDRNGPLQAALSAVAGQTVSGPFQLSRDAFFASSPVLYGKVVTT